jgi:hypothetical protein
MTGKKLGSDRKHANHQREEGMTRTDVVASSRPHRADAAPTAKGSRKPLRRLSLLPVAFVLTIALGLPTAAFAAEGLSGYARRRKPRRRRRRHTPTSSTPTSPTPTTGTSPSKEKQHPGKTTTPEKRLNRLRRRRRKSHVTAVHGLRPPLDDRGGLLLVAMGGSIVVAAPPALARQRLSRSARRRAGIAAAG